MAVRKAIIQEFKCATHSLPDKVAVCWKDPMNGLCYPVTENNLNLWSTMHVRLLANTYTICLYAYISQVENPKKYPVDMKLLEINLYNTAPHSRAPA